MTLNEKSDTLLISEEEVSPVEKKLPKKLGKEPLIDAIFEIRFSSDAPASEIIPGFLFSSLEGNKTIESLPTSQIPKPLREADPNLKFAPITRLNWGNFTINVSNFSVSVGCNYPYQGWEKFRSAIINVVSSLEKIGIINSINRYSMKYIDLIPSDDIKHQISLINMDISVADHKIESETFILRVDIIRDNFINVIQIIPSASAKLIDGTKREGIIIDVDTIHTIDDLTIKNVIDQDFSGRLDIIHKANKTMFFNCLKPETITKLEPVYD